MIANNEDRVNQSIDEINHMMEHIATIGFSNAGLSNCYLSAISIHLRDISVSLAVLADLELNKESNNV